MLPEETPGDAPFHLLDLIRAGPNFVAFREEVSRACALEPGEVTRGRAFYAWLYSHLMTRPPKLGRINPYPWLLRRLRLTRVDFPASDGVRIAGLYRPGTDPERVMVVMHGRAVNKQFMLPYVAALPADWAVLAFDFRGHGESERADSTLGYIEQRDLAGAGAFLAQRGYTRFGLWGLSQGAAVALLYAPKDPRVTAVVSEAGYANLRELLEYHREQRGLPAWPHVPIIKHYFDRRLGFDVDKVSPEQSIRGFGRPLLHVHGLDDRIVPTHHGRRIVAEAGPPARLLLLAGGHGTLLWRHGKGYSEQVVEFLREHV